MNKFKPLFLAVTLTSSSAWPPSFLAATVVSTSFYTLACTFYQFTTYFRCHWKSGPKREPGLAIFAKSPAPALRIW